MSSPDAVAMPASVAPARRGASRRRREWLAIFPSLVILGLVTLGALFAPAIAPFDPTRTRLANELMAPSFLPGQTHGHLLGTDQLGRDVFARVVYGGRVSLLVGFATVIIAGTAGVLGGLFSGYYGGVVDALLMRLADVQLSIPVILLMIIVMAVLGTGLWKLIAVLGLTGWVLFARTTRSEVLAVREQPYVDAAQSTGATDLRIIGRHVLPNVVHSTLVLATFTLPQMIQVEAALSFLGLGVQPPTPTWGNMIADGKDVLLLGVWWVGFFPGAVLFATVISINLVGDWLRNRFDPKSYRAR